MYTRFIAICILVATVGCAPRPIKEIRERAIASYRAEQTGQSMAELRVALRRRPSDAQCNYYMGLNYRRLAQHQLDEGNGPAANKMLNNALYYYTQAIKTWPNYIEAIEAKNEALETHGKYEEALASASRTTHINRGSSEKHFVFLANQYRDRGDYDNATRNYNIAIRMNENSAWAYAELGRMHLLVGDKALAIAALEKAYVLNPEQPGVVDLLADLSSDTLNKAPSPASDATASPSPQADPTSPTPSLP